MRIALFVLAAALFAIGHAVMFPQGALANLFGWATPMGAVEPVRALVALLAFALGAVSLLTGLQPAKRREPEDLNLGLRPETVAPKPIILSEAPVAPLAPFPATSAEPAAPAPLMAAAVAPVAPPEPEVVPSEPAPVEMNPPLAETQDALEEPRALQSATFAFSEPAAAALETPHQAIAASLRQALATPPGERRRAQLRELSAQVAGLAASLAALADEKRDEPATPAELVSMGPPPEPEPTPAGEPEAELQAAPELTALEFARAELEAAPANLNARSALAAALEAAPDRDATRLEEALELRRQVVQDGASEDAGLDLAASMERLADTYLLAGETGKARELLQQSLEDLTAMQGRQARCETLLYNAKVRLAALNN